MNKNNYSLEEIQNKIDDFSEHNYSKEAYSLYKNLNAYLDKIGLKKTQPEVYSKYYDVLLKLKFLSLNFFDNWDDVTHLIKHHFEVIFTIKYFDLWNKIKINLLYEASLETRDKIKEQLKKTILDCDRPVVNRAKYRNKKIPYTVKEWLTSYNVSLGIGKVNNLKRIEYLTNSDDIKSVDDKDRKKLKILFDFYEKLKRPSSDRYGFEGDIPGVVNDRNIIFTGGEAEEIPRNLQEMIRSVIDRQSKENNNHQNQNELQNLKTLAANYAPGSLERKAVEEEINKLKVES